MLSATSSAGREVGKIVCPAHWLKQLGGTVAGRITGGGENISTTISARGKRVLAIKSSTFGWLLTEFAKCAKNLQ